MFCVCHRAEHMENNNEKGCYYFLSNFIAKTVRSQRTCVFNISRGGNQISDF